MSRTVGAMMIGAALSIAASGLAPGSSPSPAAAVVNGEPAAGSGAAAVGALVAIDWDGSPLEPGDPLQFQFCSATLIDATWALTHAGCVILPAALTAFADGEIAFDDVLHSRGRMVEGERQTDLYVYASFGESDVLADAIALAQAFGTDGPDVPGYTGSFVPTETPILDPNLRPASFADDVLSDFLGAVAVLPLGEEVTVEPLAFSADPTWPNRYSPATATGFGTTAIDVLDHGTRRSAASVLRSGQTSTEPGDPTSFCESTEYTIGEMICARPLGEPGGSICLGDSGGPVVVRRGGRSIVVGLLSTLSAGAGPTCGGQPDRAVSVAAAAAWITAVTGVAGIGPEGCATTGSGTGYTAFTVPCWEAAGPHPFVDVGAKPEPYFAEAGIGFLYANEITTGVSPTLYGPDAPVTRGDLATLLYRFVQAVAEGLAPHPFVDVTRGYQQTPVSWMYEQHLTTGSPAGSSTFKAEDGVTRAEMVTFLWRLIGSPDLPVEARFVDVVTKGSDYFAAGAIAWAAETAVTTGSPAGSRFFRPDALVTRAEVATFLARFAAII